MGGADMLSMRRVGLDVHGKETTAVVLDGVSGEISAKRLVGRPDRVLEWLASLEQPFQAVYEAGPTGYGLARGAAERGLDVVVCSPGHIRKHPGDRVKTDRRDAERLARLLLAGELRQVRVPTPAEEQLRDLVRSREDLRVDLMRVRHRISKFLLRRELYYPAAGGAWTGRHRDWLSSLHFDDAASEIVLQDALHSHDWMLARRDQLERALGELAEHSPWAQTISRLRCLRGIDTLSAVGLVAEIGDFERFSHPRKLAGFLGLVPSEDTSGVVRRQGAITKAGSKHARRLLVEAGWHYRNPPRISKDLERRQRGQHPRVIDAAWRCQRRLHQRWQRLDTERGKRRTLVAVAVARELSSYCWEIATL
jgi:transposase